MYCLFIKISLLRCMIFKSKENQCLFQVLDILNKKSRTYGWMFKETKVSHTTLQSVLKFLIIKEFVDKTDEGYKIQKKGIELLEKLGEMKSLLT